ncbi:MAG TPA: S9 family peptidase [Terriglobales bacterium]|nr:S9 family peptidase [Terriglobales bacterium]
MKRRAAFFVLAVVVACSLAAPRVRAGLEPRPITEKDLFRFVWIADPQMSPDGSRVAFVRVTVNEKRDGYDTAIWTVTTTGKDAPQPLTHGPRDAAPRWSPDGATLLFLRAGERDGKPQPAQVYLLSMAGGEPRAITSLPKGAEDPSWSPDGKTIAFLSRSNAEDLAKAGKKGKGEEEHESDVRVITRAVYRLNGAGYFDFSHPAHLWTVAVPASAEDQPKPRQLTSGDFSEGEPTWSPDGKLLYFTSNRSLEPYYEPPSVALYSVPSGGGETVKVVSMDGAVGGFGLSPDGNSIAFRGEMNHRPVHSYEEEHLFVATAAPGSTPRNAAPGLDADVGAGLAGDQHAPRAGHGSAPVWSADGRAVFTTVQEKGTVNQRRFDVAGGRVQPVTNGNQEVITFTATPDRGKFVVLVSTPVSIGDLFLVQPDGSLARLTDVNHDLFSGLDLTPPEEIWYKSFDGTMIEAWVQKPPDFDPHKKYPLILDIHGGPHAAYGYGFDHEFQWMAAKGYVVLYPNPRGSSTYGENFGNIIQYHYPGDDYKDLMAGVDELIRRGYVDPQHLGVTGGSGGGILTNWTITQTTRFAAAVAQRSIADWSAFWGDADFTLFTPNWFKGAPWEDPADFAARSPITHIAKVKTPLMLIEGEADLRCPPASGGEMMFRALKYLKVPTAMIRFPGESHELSRSGQPWHRVERLEHIVNWFDIYLQGKPLHLYDLVPPQAVQTAEK